MKDISIKYAQSKTEKKIITLIKLLGLSMLFSSCHGNDVNLLEKYLLGDNHIQEIHLSKVKNGKRQVLSIDHKPTIENLLVQLKRVGQPSKYYKALHDYTLTISVSSGKEIVFLIFMKNGEKGYIALMGSFERHEIKSKAFGEIIKNYFLQKPEG